MLGRKGRKPAWVAFPVPPTPVKVSPSMGSICSSRDGSLVTWYEHALSQYILDFVGCSLACSDERLFAGDAFGVSEVVGVLEEEGED